MALTPEAFARFLSWLDADPARAPTEYERLRRRIARFFASRGCHKADELADQVFDRVVARIETLQDRYSGECAHYLYGVARNVHHEYVRREAAEARYASEVRPPRYPHAPAGEPRDKEREQPCLERCLAALTDDERRLIVQYYQTDPSTKAADRRLLAGRHGLTADTLRQRTHRLRERLKACLKRCVEGDGDPSVKEA
jgi:RNA polymerase sigma factor (sigma-70 family)